MTNWVESPDPDKRSWYYDGDGTKRKKSDNRAFAEPMSDEQMIRHLYNYANWNSEHPWKQIATRFEQLIESEKEYMNGKG